MSNVIQLVKTPPAGPTKSVLLTHDDVISLMMVLELLCEQPGVAVLDSRVYPQLQKLHSEFLQETGDDV